MQRKSGRRHFCGKTNVRNAEIAVSNLARVPFLSGFAFLLRRRKVLHQFPKVLGDCGEQEFIIFTAWSTSSEQS